MLFEYQDGVNSVRTRESIPVQYKRRYVDAISHTADDTEVKIETGSRILIWWQFVFRKAK